MFPWTLGKTRKAPVLSSEHDPEQNYFKEYKNLKDSYANFVLIEVEGDVENALDLRNNLEKLEYPGIGMTAILDMEKVALMLASTKGL